MKIFKVLLTILIIANTFTAKAYNLSDSLKVSLLTVGQGKELYSTFGHSAIRVKDLKSGHDIVFNYGTFDFDTPNFYLKFGFGLLDYQLSIQSYNGFYESFKEENRTIIESELNLDKATTLNLVQNLIVNYQPQNRAYRYKFFTDNCATRIRDILTYSTHDDSLFKPIAEYDLSYRKLYRQYLQNMAWEQFGIELLLGSYTDNQSAENALFIPDVLKKAVDSAQFNHKPLVANTNTIYSAINDEQGSSSFGSPLTFTLLILIIGIVCGFNDKSARIFDYIFFSLIGLLGLFIFVVGTFTFHQELHWNFNVFILLPTHLIFIFIRNQKVRDVYFSISLILSLIFIIPIMPQVYNLAMYPLALLTIIRAFVNTIYFKRKAASIL